MTALNRGVDMDGCLNILHMSDWHLKPDREGSNTWIIGIKKALLRFIAEVPQQSPNLLIISGDLANKGSGGDYAHVSQTIRELCEVLKLDEHKVFFVPGNHDVNHASLIANACVSDDYEGLVNKLVDNPSGKLDHAVSKSDIFNRAFEGYMKLAHEFALPNEQEGPLPGYRHVDLDISGLPVRLCGLNSALIAGPLDVGKDETQQKNRVLGFDFLDSMLGSDENRLPIIVSHYPINWIHKDERDRVVDCLKTRQALYLCGHIHQDDERLLGFWSGSQCISFCAGRVDPNERVGTPQFVLLSLDANEGRSRWMQWVWNTSHQWLPTMLIDFGNDWWRTWCKQLRPGCKPIDLPTKRESFVKSSLLEGRPLLGIRPTQTETHPSKTKDIIEQTFISINKKVSKISRRNKRVAQFKEELNKQFKDHSIAQRLAQYGRYQCQDHDEAILILERAMELDSSNPIVLCLYGEYLCNKDDRSKAEPLYEKAYRLAPDDARVVGALASIKYNLNRSVFEVESLFRLAITLDPTLAINYQNLAILTENELEDDYEAERLMRKAVELEPGNATSLADLADLTWTLHGNLNEAQLLYRKALSINGKHTRILTIYASFVWEAYRDISQAEQYFVKALKENPYSEYTLRKFAFVLWCSGGKLKQVRELLERALRIRPSEPVLICSRCAVLLASSEISEAKNDALLARRLFDRSDLQLGSIIAFYLALIASIENQDLSKALGRLKTIFAGKTRRKNWVLGPVMDTIVKYLPAERISLLKAIKDALLDETKVAMLESFLEWREAKPLELTGTDW